MQLTRAICKCIPSFCVRGGMIPQDLLLQPSNRATMGLDKAFRTCLFNPSFLAFGVFESLAGQQREREREIKLCSICTCVYMYTT